MLDRNKHLLSRLSAMSSADPSKQRPRLFKSKQLENLTLFSPAAFVVTWAILLPALMWIGWGAAGPVEAVALVVLGLLVWSLFEYAMHRYLFHWSRDWRPLQWFVFLIHGNHHANPNDPLRNLMPPVVSLPIAGLVWSGCVALIGAPGTWLFLGFISGYVAYDMLHFACHQLPMRGRMAAALKRHHMRHHHVDEHGNYAILGIFWDRVFRTRIVSLKA